MEHLLEEVEKDKAVPKEDVLKRIAYYAGKLLIAQQELKEAEEEYEKKKVVVLELEQTKLPQEMLSIGMTEFKMTQGHSVSIKEQLSCSVKSYEKLQKFLEERGDDALMKTSLELGKLPKNVLERIKKTILETFEVESESKLYIHPQTLKAYFTKLCGIGGKTEAEIPLAAIDEEMISRFTYYKTTIK